VEFDVSSSTIECNEWRIRAVTLHPGYIRYKQSIFITRLFSRRSPAAERESAKRDDTVRARLP